MITTRTLMRLHTARPRIARLLAAVGAMVAVGGLVLLGAASCSTSTCQDTGSCSAAAIVEDAGDEEESSDAHVPVKDYCKSFDKAVAFCWDFSQDIPTSARPTRPFRVATITDGPGSETSLSVESPRSLPRAGRVAAPGSDRAPGNEEGVNAAFVLTSDTIDWMRVRFSWWVKIDDVPIEDAYTVGLLYVPSSTVLTFAVDIHPSGATLREVTSTRHSDGGGAEDRVERPLRKAIQPNVWTQVAMEVALSAPSFVRLLLDGEEVASSPISGSARLLSYEGMAAYAGVLASKPRKSIVVYIDDIVIEQIP